MRRHVLTPVLLVTLSLTLHACDPEPQVCSAVIELKDEIGTELDELESATSNLESAATDLEDTIGRLRGQAAADLEGVHSTLNEVVRALTDLREQLQSKEVTATCMTPD